MDEPSQILDYLYLGTEWNACNLEELKENGITHVLNCTSEVDSFYEVRNLLITRLLYHFCSKLLPTGQGGGGDLPYWYYTPITLPLHSHYTPITLPLHSHYTPITLPLQGLFEYHTIDVLDVAHANLLKHWEDSYKFIKSCKDSGGKVKGVFS